MRFLCTLVAVFALAACGGSGPAGTGGESGGPAPLRGFGVEVDQALAARVPVVHVRTCGPWGCHEQDVPVTISGPTSAMPCPSASAAPDAACGVAQLPGPGPGYGYAPVPALTLDQVTVTVTTPPGAPVRIDAELSVRPATVCPQDPGRPAGTSEGDPASCPGGTPQARLRIAADGSVEQSR